MGRKSVVKGLAVVGMLALAAQPAHAATSWGGNGSYCAGSLFTTCFSIDLSWEGNIATLKVTNGGSEGDLIKAVAISNLASGFTYTLGGQSGYCIPGPGCPNEIGGAPLSGKGQYPYAAVAATNDQGSMPADGQMGTWTFTFTNLSGSLADANVAGHFISGPGGCSTKWEVTSGGDYNDGPTDPECSGETTVPEPATMMLLATGLVGLGGATFLRRRKENKTV